MIVEIATITEHAAISAANQSGGPIEQLERKLFSSEEFNKLRPVSAYSNYALPGHTLLSLDGFNRCVARLKNGTYRAVLPRDVNDSEKSANTREPGILVPAMVKEERSS